MNYKVLQKQIKEKKAALEEEKRVVSVMWLHLPLLSGWGCLVVGMLAVSLPSGQDTSIA